MKDPWAVISVRDQRAQQKSPPTPPLLLFKVNSSGGMGNVQSGLYGATLLRNALKNGLFASFTEAQLSGDGVWKGPVRSQHYFLRGCSELEHSSSSEQGGNLTISARLPQAVERHGTTVSTWRRRFVLEPGAGTIVLYCSINSRTSSPRESRRGAARFFPGHAEDLRTLDRETLRTRQIRLSAYLPVSLSLRTSSDRKGGSWSPL